MQITKENIINKLCFTFFLFLNVFYLVCIVYIFLVTLIILIVGYSYGMDISIDDSILVLAILAPYIIYIQLWRMKLFGFRFLYIHSGEDSLIRKFFNKIRDSRLTNFVVLIGSIVLDFMAMFFITASFNYSFTQHFIIVYILYTIFLGGIFLNYLSLSIWLRCKDKYEAILQKAENNKVLNKLKKVTIFLIKNLFLIMYILIFVIFALGLLLGFI